MFTKVLLLIITVVFSFYSEECFIYTYIALCIVFYTGCSKNHPLEILRKDWIIFSISSFANIDEPVTFWGFKT